MNPTSAAAFLFFLPALTVFASAQVQIPVNVRATYLRTGGDASAVPAPGIPLAAIGSGAGQWLNISTVGTYNPGNGSDTYRSLLCVFSSNGTLLPDGQVARVSGALAAGPAVTTANTYFTNAPTDIPQDFLAAVNQWDNGITVRVPAGASHVFVSVIDSYFSDNADPNNDYRVVFTPTSPATLQGTPEHPTLLSGVNGTPTATPDVKQASAFATINIDVGQHYGTCNGQTFLLMADVFTTGNPVPNGPFPQTFLGASAVLVQVGTVASAPAHWSVFVPPNVSGSTLLVQAAFLGGAPRNGIFQSSNAHQIQLQ